MPSEDTGPVFHINNDGAEIGKQQNAAKIVEGDEVQGDKIGNQANVEGDVHGDVNQTAFMGATELERALADVETALCEICEPLPEEGVSGSNEEPPQSNLVGGSGGINPDEITEENLGSLPKISFASEPHLHPKNVFSSAALYMKQDAEPPESEKQTFGNRLKAMFAKMGRYAGVALKNGGPVAVAAIRASAKVQFPINMIAAGLEAAVEQSRGDGSSGSRDDYSPPPPPPMPHYPES